MLRRVSFLVIGRTKEECQHAFDTLMRLLLDLGFQISPCKVVPPCQQLVFLGVQFDTINLELSLPQTKLEKTTEVVASFLTRNCATKHQLQQLACKLNWACRVVYGGRTFLRSVTDCINALQSSSAKCKLTPEFRQDLFWWHNFLLVFNGKRHFHNKLPITDAQTDACSTATGAYFWGDWVYSYLPADAPQVAPMHINYKEAFAIYIAARRWAPFWANHHVIIQCDNEAAVAMINKGSTRNTTVMAWLRHLFWLSAVHNFHTTAIHIPGKNNIVADRISRLHDLPSFLHFCQLLSIYLTPDAALATPLTDHMSLTSALFLSFRFIPRYVG